MTDTRPLHDRLDDLRRFALPTPMTRVGDPATLRRELEHDSLFYLRPVRKADGQSNVGHARKIENHLAILPPHTMWVLQRVVQLTMSGALLKPISGPLYTEVVAGNPVALLRHGYALVRWRHPTLRRHSRQSERFDFTANGISASPFYPSNTDYVEAENACGEMDSMLRKVGPPGLYEWGKSTEGIIILDFKRLAEDRISTLEDIALAQIENSSSPIHFTRPSISECPSPLPDSPIRFRSGARLAHVITNTTNKQITFEEC